jgi:hypothetical protein
MAWYGKNDDKWEDVPAPAPRVESCDHNRTIMLGTKCSDRAWVQWPNGQQTEGYAPDIPGLCDDDYINMTVCIDCKTVIGLADADAILAAMVSEDIQPPPKSHIQYTKHTGEDDGTCDVCGYPREQALCEACAHTPPPNWGGVVLLGEVAVFPYTPPPTRKKDH